MRGSVLLLLRFSKDKRYDTEKAKTIGNCNGVTLDNSGFNQALSMQMQLEVWRA
jgi:hypothetical protein